MFDYWKDFDRTFAALDELRRRLETPYFRGRYFAPTNTWPRVNIEDTGTALRVTAEIPGMSADDLGLELKQDVLTLTGKRPVSAPEGYAVHRQERRSVEFSRSYSLPAPVDPEKVLATVKDGVLDIRLEKSEAAKPRRINVKTA